METFDVVVLGTGAAALTAAIRAPTRARRVGLFEKADTVGGTSAWSGGMVWIPINPHMAELGIEDSREEVLTYLSSLSHGLIDDDLAGGHGRCRAGDGELARGEHPGQVPDHQGLPRLPPRAPGREAGRRPLARSARCSRSPSSATWQDRVTVGPQLSGNITMSETSLGRGAPERRRAGRARAAQDPRRARRRAGPDRRRCSRAAWTAASSRAPGCAPSS